MGGTSGFLLLLLLSAVIRTTYKRSAVCLTGELEFLADIDRTV